MAATTQDPTSIIKNHIDNVFGEYKKENKETVDSIKKELDELKTKAMTPDYSKAGINPSLLLGAPHVTTGQVSERGYSILKAVAYANGLIDEDQCKEEIHYANQLKALYEGLGYRSTRATGYKSFMVPYSTQHIPQFEPIGLKLASELRAKQMDTVKGYDPEEAQWVRRKALGTITDAAGGVLVGYPTLGELVDVQRNMEVFVSAGASEITLPANAMIDFPKLMNGSTAYWVGEGNAITQSQQTLGSLKLVGKKLGIIVPLNNDLLRYTSPTTEGMVRNDMAAVAARKIDLAMLEGTGGTQPLGLTNYATSTSWSYGTDKMLAYTVTSN